MKLRLCHSPTPSLPDVSEADKQDYQAIISFSTPNPTMAEGTTATSSPASLPSLAALSLASTDGDDGDGLHFMSEVPANASSKSYSVTMENQYMMDSWQSILDDEEEDIEAKISQCSSGILSAESLDMDFVEASSGSLHSLSSAKTLKSPSVRTTFDETTDAQQQEKQRHKGVEFRRVTTDDIPVQRACHGALNISPKQLANVFALFSSEREKENQEPLPDAAEEEAPIEKPKPKQLQSPIVQESCFLAPTTYPRSAQDNPFSVQQHYKSRTAHPKLTAELYWKPRAKNLEKEAEALKEILADDSCKILQLKSALETLRADKFRNLLDIQSFQEELETAKQDLENLKKEREVFLENETEYLETIRILKNEVDMLTRDGHDPSKKNTSKEHIALSVDQEELQQLRLENQLFAAQIVDYEAELERLEQQDKSLQLKENHKDRVEQRAKTSAEMVPTASKQGLAGTKETIIDDSSIFRALSGEQEQDNQETSIQKHGSVKDLVSRVPYIENVTPSRKEEGIEGTSEGALDNGSKRRTRIAVEKVSDPATSEEEMAAVQDDGASDGEDCMQQLASGMPTEFPQQIIGNVIGMFAVGGDSEGKETDKNEVFVIHEAATTSVANEDNKVPCLQWKSPDELPAFIKVDSVVPLDKAEDRNPPSSTTSDDTLSDNTKMDPSVPTASSRHEVKHRGREDTEIEVLQNGDASQSIEVQLSKPDPNKKRDHKSETSKEKCDVWNALSYCPCIASTDSQ